MTRFVRLPQIQNIGTGATASRATLDLPLGRTYNKVVFFCYGNITRAKLSDVTLKVNNAIKQKWKTSDHLQARNSYLGGASDAAIMELDFVHKNGKDESAMTMGTYALTNEAGVQSATVEFDIAAFAASGTSTIEAYAEVDVPSANTLIVRNRHQQKTLSGATTEQIMIPFGINGEQLMRMYIFGTLASIDYLGIRRDDSEEYQDVDVLKNEFLQKTYGKVPQAGLMVVDFMVHNLVGHSLNTAVVKGPGGTAKPVANLDIRLKVSAGGTFDIYTEALVLNSKP